MQLISEEILDFWKWLELFFYRKEWVKLIIPWCPLAKMVPLLCLLVSFFTKYASLQSTFESISSSIIILPLFKFTFNLFIDGPLKTHGLYERANWSIGACLDEGL